MSASSRLLWDIGVVMTDTYNIYRGTADDFSAATLIANVDANTGVYNDYALVESTTYYYWVTRVYKSAESLSGPSVSLTTAAAEVLEDAIDSDKEDALWQWANDALDSLFPVTWRYQPVPQMPKPRVLLNFMGATQFGWDDVRDNSKLLSGSRTGVVSVLVMSDPRPPKRGLVTVKTLEAGEYLVKLNDVDYSVIYGSTPSSKNVVLQDLLTKILATNNKTLTAWIYGVAGAVEGLAIASFDPDVVLTMNNTANLDIVLMTPPNAMTIANRMAASLGDQALRDPLNAANIGIGSVGDVKDLSALLDTRYELRAQFDFKVNLSSNRPISTPTIDTVESIAGTFS